jgi:hypothetical protein
MLERVARGLYVSKSSVIKNHEIDANSDSLEKFKKKKETPKAKIADDGKKGNRAWEEAMASASSSDKT